MKRILKWLAIGLAGLIGLLIYKGWISSTNQFIILAATTLLASFFIYLLARKKRRG